MLLALLARRVELGLDKLEQDLELVVAHFRGGQITQDDGDAPVAGLAQLDRVASTAECLEAATSQRLGVCLHRRHPQRHEQSDHLERQLQHLVLAALEAGEQLLHERLDQG